MKSQNKYLKFHKVGIIGILLISIMLISSIPLVSSVSIIENTTGNKFNEEPYQKKLFYAKGLYWMFYCDDDDDNAYFEVSYDGETWFGKTKVNQALDGIINKGARIAVHYDVNTDNIHYFLTRYAIFQYYRMGVPQTDGTITWVKAEETDTRTGGTRNSHIVTDSEGYPILAYNEYAGANQGPSIYYSSKKDGDLAIYEKERMLIGDSEINWRIMSVPHTRPNLSVVYWLPNEVIRVRTFDGSSWTSEVTTDNITTRNVASVGIGNIVHIVYDYLDIDTKYDIWYIQFDYDTGLFNVPVKIAEDYDDEIAPAITKDGTNLVVTFISQSKIYYLNYISKVGTWTAISEVYDESVKGITGNYRFSSYYQVYNNSVGITWVATATSNDLTFYSFAHVKPTCKFINADLYTVVGNTRVLNDGWLFMGEIYQLESTIQNMTHYYLELDDGENTLRFYYTNKTKSLNITQSEQFLGGLIDSSIETVNETLKQYKCTWTFILNRNIVDNEGLYITYYGYNEPEDLDIDGLAIMELNIYNLGGLTYYEFVGDGGRTAQGTPFELYATNGSTSSSAKAEQVFRKLQSVHFLMEIDMGNEWDNGNGEFDIDAGVGYVDIGIDYRLDGSWVDGYYIRLYVQDADVGHHDAGNDNNWIEWSVDFYNYDPYYDFVVNLKSQLIYSNHWGYDGENLDPDHHINRTSSQLWIDLWFDRTNASTTIATQVNSYYRGMKEHGSAWWFGYGVFQPMVSDYDNAKFLDDLYDEDGEISNCQKIELVKFWIKVGKVNIDDGNDETWTIRAIEDMNREQAIDRMMGVDEPTFSECKVLDMPQTGFVNSFKTAINNLSVTIWLGAFQFIKMLMASIGYLMSAIGLGVWWESFIIMLGNIATASLAFMDQLQVALFNSVLLIEQITRLLSSGIIRYTYALTQFISSIILWYDYIIEMFSGGGIWSINVWTSLNLEDIFILLMHLSPVWWINRLNESDHFIETLQGDLRFIIMLVTGLFNFLSSVIIVTMTLINILLGMLPI